MDGKPLPGLVQVAEWEAYYLGKKDDAARRISAIVGVLGVSFYFFNGNQSGPNDPPDVSAPPNK